MIGRAFAGLLAAQALYLVAGAGLLFAFQSWRTWSSWLRSLGLAYLLGVAATGAIASAILPLGGNVSTPVVLAVTLGLAAAGIAVGAARGHRLPRVHGFTLPGRSPESLVATALALLTVFVLGDLWRAARWQGVVAWDAWAFWMPKAKAIYFFGGLDPHLFRALANPTYPLLVPALQAMDFHLMGSAAQSLVALQYWFLLAGFVAAAAYLLRPIARPAFYWPFLGLATVMPELDKRIFNQQGDWPLDIFFAIAALCVARWLLTREWWLLAPYGVLAAGIFATKREGQLLLVCLLAPLLAASWRRARTAWPAIAGATAVGYVLQLPWHHWYTSRHLVSDSHVGLGQLASYSDRAGPAYRIVAGLLFDQNLWLIALPIALAAGALTLLRRDYALGTLFLGTTALGYLGFGWVLWSFTWLPLDYSQQTPIPREVASLVMLATVLAPLLLSRAAAPAEEPVTGLAQPTAAASV